LSLLIAVLFVLLLLPQFNIITEKQLSFDLNLNFIIQIIFITVITGVLSGIYPAFYLSGFNTVKILKGVLKNTFGEILIRKGSIIIQFTISVILILSIVVVYNQIELIQSKNLGYERENILYIDIEGKVQNNQDTFINEIKNIPGVVNASSIGQNIIGGNLNGFVIDEWAGKDPNDRRSFQMRAVGHEMIETLGIEMISGRAFSKDFKSDDSKIIFNEAAIAYMGLKNPIGQTIKIQGTALEILGVAKDFHFASLHEPINPLFFVLRPSWTDKIMIKTERGKEDIVIKKLEKLYSNFNPEFLFDYQFLNQQYMAQYKAEQRVSILSKYFAVLAILISCLGLFGLAMFTAERRRKEIGIRKALGQRKSQIVILLSNEFSRLIVIAIVIGLPVAFIFSKSWLSGFAYKIDLNIWYFLIAGVGSLFIALITISMQTINAASKNPIEALREE